MAESMWRRRHEFAQEAEALGLTTAHVVAVAQEVRIVTYVADAETDDPNQQLLAAVLVAERELGLLQVFVRDLRVGTVGSMIREAHERLGEPPDGPS